MKPKTHQGKFLAQLREKRPAKGALRKFDYANQYGSGQSEARVTGKIEDGAKRSPEAPLAALGKDMPEKLNGRPDLIAIRTSLADDIRAQKKKRFG